MEKFIELDNKKYILHDCVITVQNSHHYKAAFKKFNCIDGEVKQFVKDGWFSKGFVLCSVYIPITDTAEKAIEQFQDFVENRKDVHPHTLILIGIISVAVLGATAYYIMKNKSLGIEQKPSTASRIKAFFKSASLKVKSYFTKN